MIAQRLDTAPGAPVLSPFPNWGAQPLASRAPTAAPALEGRGSASRRPSWRWRACARGPGAGGRKVPFPCGVRADRSPCRAPAKRRLGRYRCIAAAPGPERWEACARCAPFNADTVCSRRRAARLQGPFSLRLPHRDMPGRGEFKRRSLPRPGVRFTGSLSRDGRKVLYDGRYTEAPKVWERRIVGILRATHDLLNGGPDASPFSRLRAQPGTSRFIGAGLAGGTCPPDTAGLAGRTALRLPGRRAPGGLPLAPRRPDQRRSAPTPLTRREAPGERRTEPVSAVGWAPERVWPRGASAPGPARAPAASRYRVSGVRGTPVRTRISAPRVSGGAGRCASRTPSSEAVGAPARARHAHRSV